MTGDRFGHTQLGRRLGVTVCLTLVAVACTGLLVGCPFPPPNPEQGCLDSEGTVSTAMCCLSTSDYPGTCAVGACGCSPVNSHEVTVCDCGAGRCFNGLRCVDVP